MSPEQRILNLVRETEKVAGQLDPSSQSAERGELIILASRLRSVYQKLVTKSG
jgi:hypothetical protein